MKLKKLFILLVFSTLTFYASAQNWSGLGSGVDGTVYATAVYNNELYVAGGFSYAGGNAAGNIAKWNGTSWSTVGAGIPQNWGGGSVRSLAVYNGKLYASGNFLKAAGAPADHYCVWNGTSWTDMSTKPDGAAIAMAEYNSELYAIGTFSSSGSTTTNGIAKWNGTTWSAVGAGIKGLNALALCVYNNELYVGGQFTAAAGNVADLIVKWDGSNFSAVGAGITCNNNLNKICALAVYNSQLVATGHFSSLNGGTAADKIAIWNGTIWAPMGLGLDNYGFALVEYNSNLIAGGTFLNAGGTPASNVAKWDGTAWSKLGNGSGNTVQCLIIYNSNLYAAGNMSPGYIIKWNEPATIPAAPTNLTASPTVKTNSAGKIRLNWTDNSNNEIGFRIQRSPNGSSSWSTIDSVTSNVVTYVDSGLASSTTYYYQVKSYNSAGSSSFSNQVNATTYTAIQENNAAQVSVSIFPNPFSGKANVKIQNASNLKNMELKIFDILGKELRNIPVNSSEMILNRGDLQSGVYFYFMMSGKDVLSNGRLIVE